MPLTEQLTLAVESQLGVRADYEGFVLVEDVDAAQTPWRGYVHLFRVSGHATATQAFAWASHVNGNQSFTAALRVPPINTPNEAIRLRQASALSEPSSGGDSGV
jgi:hypothetical protein